MDNKIIKDTMVSNETLLLIPKEVLQSGVLNSGNPITQTVLCKWLREIPRTYVTSLPSYRDDTAVKKFFFEIAFSNKLKQMGNKFGYFDTYEEALEKGLQQALKLIIKRDKNAE